MSPAWKSTFRNRMTDFETQRGPRPEILVYLAVTTAGIALAKSVIDLITTIIKARSEGIQKGDHPSAPIELIVRRAYKDGEVHEGKVLRVAHIDVVDPTMIEKKLEACLAKLVNGEPEGTDNT